MTAPSNLVTERSENQIRLSWDYKHNDDISYIIYRQENDNRMISYKRVEGETTFTDNNIKKKSVYAYAVKTIRKDGKESKLSESLSVK